MTIQTLKQQFNDEKLFALALTHRSWINENPGIRESNERLEFLGDAVLELVVSHAIYLQFPDQEEGFLTSIRANIVNTINLAKVARTLSVGEVMLLSRGEESGGGRDNQSLLADTVEAIIGAIYLDQGFDAAKAFIDAHILVDISTHLAKPLKDAKSRLQEFVQAQGSNAPKYKVVDEHGPDHAKEFVIEVSVEGNALGRGEGKSKSVAEQDAAEHALESLTKKA